MRYCPEKAVPAASQAWDGPPGDVPRPARAVYLLLCHAGGSFLTDRSAVYPESVQGYEKAHPQAEYLKFKSWYLEYPLKDEELADAEAFTARAAELFRIMKPFNDYLNKALAGLS